MRTSRLAHMGTAETLHQTQSALPLQEPNDSDYARKHPMKIAHVLSIVFLGLSLAIPLAQAAEETPSSTDASALTGLINIAPRAGIQAYPYLWEVSRRALTDGAAETLAVFERGIETGAELTFLFPKPVAVQAVRFFQGKPAPKQEEKDFGGSAKSFVLKGRYAGSSQWEVLLEVQGKATGGWETPSLSKGRQGARPSR